jgi:hypothetical protein
MVDVRMLTAFIIALTMEAVSTSETYVTFYQTTGRNIPEDRIFHMCAVFVYPFDETKHT